MPKVKMNERAKSFFSKGVSRKLLNCIKSVDPLDEDTVWFFHEVFEDSGYRRLDKDHELEKALYKLSHEVREFRKTAIRYWKTYNRYSQKGL